MKLLIRRRMRGRRRRLSLIEKRMSSRLESL